MKYELRATVILLISLILLISSVNCLLFDQETNVATQTILNVSNDYFVDNISNVDSSSDKGAHSNFTAQQYGPDSVYDVLTEENGGVGDGLLLLYVNAYDGARTEWTRVGEAPYLSVVDYDSNYVHASKNNYEVGDFGFEDSGLSSATIQSVTIQLYAEQTKNKQLQLFVWDGSTWTDLGNQVLDSSWGWINYTVTSELDSWTKIDAAKIYMQTTSGAGTYEVDCARLVVDYFEPDNYEVDLEVQWNSVDFDGANEFLCICGGTMGSEDIKVDVWDGSSWVNLVADLSPGWNNVTVAPYLTSSTFTIRFKGATETNDTNQDSWEIDATLLHVWN
jgi:hypothetical protein